MALSNSVLKRRSRQISTTDERAFLASCRCEVLQPMNVNLPDIEEWQQQKGESAHNRKGPMLIPAGEKTLCLIVCELQGSISYQLIIENDNHEVFLQIFLEDTKTGRVDYRIEDLCWHQVTLQPSSRKLIFKFSKGPAVEKFQAELVKVFEIIQTGQHPDIGTTLGTSGVYTKALDETWEPPLNESPYTLPRPQEFPDPFNRPPARLPPQHSEGLEGPKDLPSSEPPLTGGPNLGESSPYMSMRGLLIQRGAMDGAAPTTLQRPTSQSSMHPESMPASQGVPGSMPGAHTPTAHKEHLTKQMELLSLAIRTGDVTKAQNLVAELAQSKLPLNITVDQSLQEAEEPEFRLKVVIEDRDSAGVTRTIKVKPSYTIKMLKQMMEVQLGFPQGVQHWIVGRRIADDKDTLSFHRVRGEGHTLHLYLVAARSVNLTPEGYSRQGSYGNLAAGASGDYMTMQALQAMQVARGNAAAPNRQQSTQSNNTNPSLTTAPPTPGQPFPLPAQPPRAPDTPAPAPLLVEGVQQGGRGQQGKEAAAPGRRPAQEDEPPQVGWNCPQCTLINKPWRPGCEACAAERPTSYKVPQNYVMSAEEHLLMQQMTEEERLARQVEDEERQQSYQALLDADSRDLVANTEAFDCLICFDSVASGRGVVLRDCLHTFCKSCLQDAVAHNEEAILKCPYQDNQYRCEANLQEREIRALVSEDVFKRFLQRGLDRAEGQADNSYHCKTPDCRGWCFYEDAVNFFQCQVCGRQNCLTCKAIHEGMNCKQYQEDLHIRSANDQAAKKTKEMLERLVSEGEAMHCPKCRVILQKKEGCDWLQCSFCKTEICWVTRGPRWGLMGPGDTSGGCRCNINGQRCHPKCGNCH